jgi:Txe/YoeB family toxin of Txe-Axe toxin-antitoxin module
MIILPLHHEILKYLEKRGLKRKFEKQSKVFEKSPFHPGLHTELLKPRHLRLWSFRVDQKYRAIFIFRKVDTVEILDINNHYQ